MYRSLERKKEIEKCKKLIYNTRKNITGKYMSHQFLLGHSMKALLWMELLEDMEFKNLNFPFNSSGFIIIPLASKNYTKNENIDNPKEMKICPWYI